VSIDPDGPTLGEIARVAYDIRQELRAMRAEHVRTDVYAVAHKAILDKINDLEAEVRDFRETRRAYQRMAVGAIVAAAGSLVVQFVITVLGNQP
jgi:hypothetical protein